jgi:Flp pilus assembly protein TadD
MLVQKVRLWFNHYEVPDNQDMYFVARYSPVLRWSLPGFGWIFPLGVLGLIVSWPRPDVRLIAATMALYSCSVILFFVLARFRQPLIPFWVVFASLGGRWLVRAAGRREFRRVAMATAGMALCGLVAVSDLPFHDRGVNLALAWHNLGALQARVGRFDEGLASEEAAAGLLPDDEDIATSLGRFYLHLGRFEEAERALLHAVAVNPASSDAWLALGDVYQQTGRENLARDSYDRANAASATRRSPPDAGSGF